MTEARGSVGSNSDEALETIEYRARDRRFESSSLLPPSLSHRPPGPAASKKKGMWMGSNVPYDADKRALMINPAEAETVRRPLRALSRARLRAPGQGRGPLDTQLREPRNYCC